ncbi:MAG: CHASE2 domain-containing protein, partial [Armatimonadetes bacterium]|nr:CHASE2 domain-containing protein [Armatimonadota bacterium]
MAGRSSPGSRSAYKIVGRFVLIAAACTLVMLVAAFWPQVTILDRMELRTVDWRFHLRGPLEPHPDIVLITIDEASLDKLGKWPWPRAVFARLTRKLTAARVQTIVYDVFFIEPELEPAGDAAFAQALASAGNVYLAGFAAGPEQEGDYGPDLGVREMAPAGQAEMLRHWAWNEATVTRGEGLLRWAGIYQLPDLTYPFARLARGAQGLGYTCLVQGADGIFRYTPPLGYFRHRLYPSLPLAVAAGLLDARPGQISVNFGHNLRLDDQHTVPLDRWGRMVINFAGKHKTYPHLPAWQILDESQDAAQLELADKIIIVAITAEGLH